MIIDNSPQKINKEAEIGINILGLLTESYSAYGELGLTSDGLTSLNARFTYENLNLFGVKDEGFSTKVSLRIYPALYRNGFFFYACSGYSNEKLSGDNFTTIQLASVPVLAGIGYKWAINQVAIDLYFGAGRTIWLGDSSALNNTILNYALECGLLVGYRF